MASIFDLFSNAPAQAAANAQTSAINTGLTNATSAINTGLGQATTSYTAGLQPFIQNSATANAGTAALGNLLGLNGAAGNASATQQLENTPGYSFALNQGTQNAERNQASTGQLASGATDVALQQVGQGTALNSAYAPYLQALQQYLPYSTQSAGGQAGLYSGLATAQSNAGNNLGDLQYGANTSIGNAQANAALANNNAAANMFGGLSGLLGGAAGLSGAQSANGAGIGAALGKAGSSLGSSLLSFV
jgi:hypothetical protein